VLAGGCGWRSRLHTGFKSRQRSIAVGDVSR
jgi:hypothetical protein